MCSWLARRSLERELDRQRPAGHREHLEQVPRAGGQALHVCEHRLVQRQRAAAPLERWAVPRQLADEERAAARLGDHLGRKRRAPACRAAASPALRPHPAAMAPSDSSRRCKRALSRTSCRPARAARGSPRPRCDGSARAAPAPARAARADSPRTSPHRGRATARRRCTARAAAGRDARQAARRTRQTRAAAAPAGRRCPSSAPAPPRRRARAPGRCAPARTPRAASAPTRPRAGSLRR